MSKVIITGVTGQAGSYMADYLVGQGHDVYGVARPTSSENYGNLGEVIDKENFHVVRADLTDEVSINNLVAKVEPDFFLNFAAHSFVGDSWDHPMHVLDVNAGGVIRCLEAIKQFAPHCRFHNSGTSEEFGDVDYSPQDSKHPLKPRSPYGASKVAARHYVKVYRESYGMFAIQSWAHNHESERRSHQFVTRKITSGLAKIKRQLERGEDTTPLVLGNLYARRDWSHAMDVVRAIWLMVSAEQPKDYVVASGETHTVKEMLELAMWFAGIECVDVNPDNLEPSHGENLGYQLNYETKNGQALVVVSRDFYRPAEVDLLMGDSTPLREELGWEPQIDFFDLIGEMTENDLILTK